MEHGPRQKGRLKGLVIVAPHETAGPIIPACRQMLNRVSPPGSQVGRTEAYRQTVAGPKGVCLVDDLLENVDLPGYLHHVRIDRLDPAEDTSRTVSGSVSPGSGEESVSSCITS